MHIARQMGIMAAAAMSGFSSMLPPGGFLDAPYTGRRFRTGKLYPFSSTRQHERTKRQIAAGQLTYDHVKIAA